MVAGTELVWYVAYGSNLAMERLKAYLDGGRPMGGLRTYAGARDPGEPRRTRPVTLAGSLSFAGKSTAWTGGVAFYDPRGGGEVAARGYLITLEQAGDLVAQELRRSPGSDLDLLAERPGETRPLDSRFYDVALRLEDINDHPALGITSSRPLEPTAPGPSYLQWICRGLHETYDWSPSRIAEYLEPAPGVLGAWTAAELAGLAGDALLGI